MHRSHGGNPTRFVNVTPLIALAILTLSTGTRANAQYHTWPQIEAALAQAAADHPSICQRISVGQSTQGRNLWAVCITDNVGVEEDEPEFRYISSIHGNETIGVEMCLLLIDYLTDNYGADPRVTNLVDSVEIWIMPLMNPDGFVAGTRYNARGVDLNRNFPCPYTSPNNTTDGREVETAAVMNWAFGRAFTLSANFHSGALVVNYPFDANATGQPVYTPTPDDAMFVYVSEQYSVHNPPMWNNPAFPHGVTNGADWYVIYGGLQDWSYVYNGCNDVTIELANNTPPAAQIPVWWSNNRESMLAYIETCLTVGVRGLVRDGHTGAPLAATVRVAGRAHDVFTDPDVGDYHRMIEDGVYDLSFESPGRESETIRNVPVSIGEATRLDVNLWRTEIVSPNGGEMLSREPVVLIEWCGSPNARFQVQYTPNVSASFRRIDGFESGVLDLGFSTGGAAAWSIVSGIAHGGTRSARSGTIGHNRTSWLQRTVLGGPTSFWYRVSSESNHDWFDFYVDGQRLVHASGTVGWTFFSVSLPPGSHVLRWEYVKDAGGTSGSDAAWIDDLTTNEPAAAWSDVAALTDVGVTSVAWTPTFGGADFGVRVRSYRDDAGFGPWDAGDGPFTICLFGDADADGQLTAADVPTFVALLLADAPAGTMQRCAVDFNRDGVIDGDDVQAFVDALWGGDLP